MNLEPLLIVELALLGLGTGLLAGLLGIGGGMMMVPFITIIFTSISSVRAHHKRRAVRWDLVKGLVPGIVLGGAAASLGVFSALKGAWLALLFAAFVSFSATQMLLDKKPVPTRQVPGVAGLLGAGGCIGFLSGLVGAGGGFVSVPFMVWCNVTMLNAVATSAALGFPIALANVIGYTISGQGVQDLPPHSFGYIWLPALAVIASCSIMTAPLGARAAHLLPVCQLKRVFAGILVLLASYMFYKGLSSA